MGLKFFIYCFSLPAVRWTYCIPNSRFRGFFRFYYGRVFVQVQLSSIKEVTTTKGQAPAYGAASISSGIQKVSRWQEIVGLLTQEFVLKFVVRGSSNKQTRFTIWTFLLRIWLKFPAGVGTHQHPRHSFSNLVGFWFPSSQEKGLVECELVGV